MPKRVAAPKLRRRSFPTAAQETELARRTRERDEALEQFSATSEVLKVISGSAGELEPVFGALLDNATRICEATSGLLIRAENDGFRIAASLRQRADMDEWKHRQSAELYGRDRSCTSRTSLKIGLIWNANRSLYGPSSRQTCERCLSSQC